MNKSESKYYNTALLMNQALIELLNKKDYEFITIKEICKKAGVNRSTFYLHYDNIDDLLTEIVENTNKNFLSCFGKLNDEFSKKMRVGKKEDLILITPEYLLPYLNHIKENKVIYQISAKHPHLMQSAKKYNLLKENVLYPIFMKFNMQKNQQKYFLVYYINGIYAIIDEWIKDGCKDEINLVMDAIIKCVHPFEKDNDDNRKN